MRDLKAISIARQSRRTLPTGVRRRSERLMFDRSSASATIKKPLTPVKLWVGRQYRHGRSA